MPLLCPRCSGATLEITESLELSSDLRWDEIMLQVIACDQCGFSGVATYLESRRGAGEIVDHTGFYADHSEVERVRGLIQGCPDHHNKHCDCAGHQSLNMRNEHDRWTAADHLYPLDHFTIEYVR